MAQVKITVRPNGPFRVEAPEGSVELVDVNGNKYRVVERSFESRQLGCDAR